MLVKTKFTKRYGPYLQGADPELEEALAVSLQERGLCRIVTAQTTETKQNGTSGDNVPNIDSTSDAKPSEAAPKSRGKRARNTPKSSD